MDQVTKITFNIVSDSFPNLQKNLREYEQHCVTYLIHNDQAIYIGETSHLRNRIKNHSEGKRKHDLKQTKIIISDFFNKSAIYDIESKLINYIFAENKFDVLNIKANQTPHNYYLKEKFNNEMFKEMWAKLKDHKIVSKSLEEIENTHLFKYSPFKQLSMDQTNIVDDVTKALIVETPLKDFAYDGSRVRVHKFNTTPQKIMIKGGPGTGKTLIIMKLIYELNRKYLVDTSKVAICIPQSNLLSTFKAMVRQAKLKIKVIRPVDLSRLKDGELDLLIVDETHRLKKHFSKQAKDLKHLLGGKITELDLAAKKSKHLVLMYDQKQTVRPADIKLDEVQRLKGFVTYYLKQQFRVKDGFDYLKFIEQLLQIEQGKPDAKDLGRYEFKIVDTIQELRKKILEKNKEYELCRMASGYYKEWISKSKPSLYDFEDEGVKLRWNTTILKWAHTPNAINEIGCIHTLQGEDLNYAGIIIGDDIYLDPEDNIIKVNKQNYYDKNGTPLNGSDEDNILLTKYIKNIYYVLLTRGMLGTYLFIKDKNLKKHFQKVLSLKD
jgi:DUF2075 family protein/DNA replication protein DnaC